VFALEHKFSGLWRCFGNQKGIPETSKYFDSRGELKTVPFEKRILKQNSIQN